MSCELQPLKEGLAEEGKAPGNADLLDQAVVCRFLNGVEKGYHSKMITFHTEHPDYPVLAVSIRWEAVAELNFTPSALHFGVMADGAEAVRRVTLISESESLNVQQAEVSGAGFRLEDQSQSASNRVEFVVAARAAGTAGVGKGKLTVETTEGKNCMAELIMLVE